MKIAIDISPLTSGHYLQHRIRGTGFYLEHLKQSLTTNFRENDYVFFKHGDVLPDDIDIIHIPYFEPFFLIPGKRYPHKTVVTVHDLTPIVFPKAFPAGIKGKLKWVLQRRALKKTDYIITDSHASKNDIARFTGISEKKISVVYLAAGKEFKVIKDSEYKAQHLRKKYNLPQKFALYVGDVTWNKNLPRLLQAVLQTPIPLILVGKTLVSKKYDKTNPWNQDLVKAQQLAENNKQTHLLGYVSTEDLAGLYNLATVFVMPSLYEGFGLPVLEAMQSGCPVVTSHQGSLKEVADDAAYIVDPYSVQSIRDGVQEVFEDIKLQKILSEKGLKYAKNFSWEKTARETIAVYKHVLAETQ